MDDKSRSKRPISLFAAQLPFLIPVGSLTLWSSLAVLYRPLSPSYFAPTHAWMAHFEVTESAGLNVLRGVNVAICHLGHARGASATHGPPRTFSIRGKCTMGPLCALQLTFHVVFYRSPLGLVRMAPLKSNPEGLKGTRNGLCGG